MWAFFAADFGGYALAAFAGSAAGAATTEWVVVNRYTGLAIDGFDPVAYFVDAAPKEGRAELELRFGGATWRFQNEGNRCGVRGGSRRLCAALRRTRSGGGGARRSDAGHPVLWLIAEQRLYLFYSAEARAAFARDPETPSKPPSGIGRRCSALWFVISSAPSDRRVAMKPGTRKSPCP